jgi:alpha-beta hydrolase superfamily lysophospholipase
MDSKTSLGWKDISPRYSAEHMENIRAVVKFYKEKTKKPVYLIGHSNGSISIAEFLNKSADSQKLVAGVILSAGRNETNIDVKLTIPVLVMIHEQDMNVWTTPTASINLYEKIKATNDKAKLAFIHGGYNEMGNPATNGRHMYAGSLDEVAVTLNSFLSSSLPNNIK